MTYDLVVRSTRGITPGGEAPVAVAVRNGLIAALEPYAARLDTDQDVDLGDDALLPGLVDTHVHVNEPGRTEWEGFATATRAAAAGGVTTLLDMPLNSVPPTVTVTALAAKRAAAYGKCFVDVGFWGGAIPGNLTELLPMHRAGVFGFKCFLLDSGVAEFAPLDEDGLRAAMVELARFDPPSMLIVHAEEAGEIGEHTGRRFGDFVASRPPRAERRAIEKVVRASAATGTRAHIVHLSAAECAGLVAGAKAAGVPLTAETCPHYLFLTADEVPDGATQFKCCPPIRDGFNREALWRALTDGVLDLVVSDHSPCPPEMKHADSGDFGAAWGGIASLQIALPVVWTAARRRGVELADVVRWMAREPARLARLTGKGRLAVGCDADLVAFAPEDTFTVRARELHHRHPVTPYDGRTLTGVVRSTWLRGVPVTGEGEPRGRLLTPPHVNGS